ncbi:hypothetical protein SAMN00017405_0432 [Desulfonispora thiosulfatigenes DSM 11270]|uniref:Nucleoid-associated protein n=1 Tax=Desulfonispora thiosulfatigenes DSM 11270 TaxID=656914 RepID=A0A1W1VQE7_DESTI|nr:nucleoid-associated protein [Desulfonispora thiosulfatigenes]SMB95566.1 hypothetical protein SAMN00017405_0432 [Desulfonispora thiosulfatigenes DSM 11270]
MKSDDIFIRKLVVHILDKNIGLPVLSDLELSLTSEISEFITKHIRKVLKDASLKEAKFINNECQAQKLCGKLKEDYSSFLMVTRKFASKFFEQMNNFIDISNGDLACCLFEISNKKYYAMIKFNYKESYIHQVKNVENGTLNTIIKQKTVLPNDNQRVEEFVIINLDDFSIKLLEKKFDKDGSKQFYISNEILECTSDLSGKDKVKVLEKTTKEMVSKYFDDSDISKIVEFKRIVSENINDSSVVDVHEIADTVFGDIAEVREEYIKQIQKNGISEKKIPVNFDQTRNVYKKQKIVTDTGIEINLLVDEFTNKDKIEFINNEDGTVSILLKNIKEFK